MLRVVHFWGQERGLPVGQSALLVTKKESSQEGKKSIRLSMKYGHDFAIDLAILLARPEKIGDKVGERQSEGIFDIIYGGIWIFFQLNLLPPYSIHLQGMTFYRGHINWIHT